MIAHATRSYPLAAVPLLLRQLTALAPCALLAQISQIVASAVGSPVARKSLHLWGVTYGHAIPYSTFKWNHPPGSCSQHAPLIFLSRPARVRIGAPSCFANRSWLWLRAAKRCRHHDRSQLLRILIVDNCCGFCNDIIANQLVLY